MARIKHYNSATQQWEYSDISSAVKGDVGATPNLSIGTVQTLASGANATATITGTAENPVLNLGLPRGEAGEADGAVMYNSNQSLTTEQKQRARNNIGAISASEVMADVFYAGSSAPSNTKLLWIDTNSTVGGLKYYNGNSWVHVPVAYT